MDNIFTEAFWIHEWEKTKSDDTCAVHKGYATPEYWDQTATLDQEIQNQLAFFKKVCTRPQTQLRQIIRTCLETMQKDGSVTRRQKGLTATAVWAKDRW